MQSLIDNGKATINMLSNNWFGTIFFEKLFNETNYATIPNPKTPAYRIKQVR